MIDFDKILFNIDIASGMPNQRALLVAEPFLKDQYFGHSVIFLVDYAPMGNAMGIVVNTPTAYTLQGLVKGIIREEGIPVWCGGPMSCDRLYYIHTLGRLIPGSREIVPGDVGICVFRQVAVAGRWAGNAVRDDFRRDGGEIFFSASGMV